MSGSTSRKLEVADILRAHGEAYQQMHRVSPEQAQAIQNITACRTAKLGGHVDACADCGFRRISYNSCRDRHCPKCQATKRAAWLETRLERLLPVPHFHVVFTLPEQLQPLVLKNQRVLYSLLFRAASQTLLTALYGCDWIVYAKAPFGGAEQVYRYLGRYTHRVAIANARLLSHQEGRVQFRYKDYADASQTKVMSLTAEEFIRRFLLHVLPKGFVRIRNYGLLASRNVSTRLAALFNTQLRACSLRSTPVNR